VPLAIASAAVTTVGITAPANTANKAAVKDCFIFSLGYFFFYF
jgi:hypothetical protein